VRDEAADVGAILNDRLPAAIAPLLAGFRIAVAASIDARGRVWASLLTGPAGFLRAVGETRLRVAATPLPGDPLLANLAGRPEVGLILFDPASRRRLRINGKAVQDGEGGGFSIAVEQAYGNCRKYIQARRLEDEARAPAADAAGAAPGAAGAAPAGAARVLCSSALSPAQQARIGAADTFFIASAHPEGGADASHRGGRPGFVRVTGARNLSFPDYAGNNMYNTLGNLAGDAHAGLLFVDFETGDLLQVTGRARLVWEREVVAQHRGARHAVVEYEVDEVRETPGGAGTLRWVLVEPSPFNP
jgi:predicted pyridoxine 5'-phosphate oxidase superfamily flavin-nucleotide-binding protein